MIYVSLIVVIFVQVSFTIYTDLIRPDTYLIIERFDKNKILIEKTKVKSIKIYGDKSGRIKKCILTQEDYK